jgi:voltage-gated potassium channel
MPKTSIVIFGYHSTAVEVPTYLRSQDYRITIIDDNEEKRAKARYAGFGTARLDYRDDAERKKLGLGRDVEVVFSLFTDDAENVFLVISVRALAPDLLIFNHLWYVCFQQVDGKAGFQCQITGPVDNAVH